MQKALWLSTLTTRYVDSYVTKKLQKVEEYLFENNTQLYYFDHHHYIV